MNAISNEWYKEISIETIDCIPFKEFFEQFNTLVENKKKIMNDEGS